MRQVCVLIWLLTTVLTAVSQVIPATRTTNWSLAGYQDTVPHYATIIDITTVGGMGDGVTNNTTAFQAAITALAGGSGTIIFPAGTFLFTSSITLPDSVVLKGAGADSTTLRFNLNGNGDMIRMAGSISSSVVQITAHADKDSSFITVADSTMFSTGDWIKIYQNDSSLIFSNWAYQSVAQIVQIMNKDGDTLILKSPLRRTFRIADNPRVRKMTPRTGCGIECLKLFRVDSTAGQTTNVDFNYSVKCWIKGVESERTNFAHVAISNSSNIEVSGCYFYDSYGFGGGGRAYGVTVQYGSGECLIENNIFNHLRHSMLLQAGANGNVLAYNNSTNPFWTGVALPAASAGDIVLHGNYTFMNLFEGNIVQNIVIDDSHGKNGPFNTLFRNRADLYGIFMNTNPATDSQNIVGNEVTNTGFLMGMYSLSGTGHFTYGNNIKGNIMPSGTNNLGDASYYRQTAPPYFGFMPWPSIGPPNTLSSGTIPAQQRWLGSGDITDCSTHYPMVITTIEAMQNKAALISVYPNPATDQLFIKLPDLGGGPADLRVFDLTGRLMISTVTTQKDNTLDLRDLAAGNYLLMVRATLGTETFRLSILR